MPPRTIFFFHEWNFIENITENNHQNLTIPINEIGQNFALNFSGNKNPYKFTAIDSWNTTFYAKIYLVFFLSTFIA